MRVEVEGLNLERLLRSAALEGISLRDIRREDARRIMARLPFWEKKRFFALCRKVGWDVRVRRMDRPERALALMAHRPMLPAGAALFLCLCWLSSQMIWKIDIENAGEHIGEVRLFLKEERVRPGALRRAHRADDLQSALALRLPGFSFVGVRYAGSTLIVDCFPATQGENLDAAGAERDLLALCDGVVTEIVVRSGTPVVSPGMVVRAGQVLVKGEERGKTGETRPVVAQGQVRARVWACGEAKASLSYEKRTETGRLRESKTLVTPWARKTISEAEPFPAQSVERERLPLVGLYLPVYWEIERMIEEKIEKVETNEADARSVAQGAAEKIAKKKCPSDAIILDKCVNYSMIDHEFVYATVVLAYERDIACRKDAPHAGF